MKKLRYLLRIVVLFCVFLIIGTVLFGNPLVAWHNHQLKIAMQHLPEGTVTLEEVVPFAWDMVYSFDPYTSREEMASVMHLKSVLIQESISEEQRSVIFTRGDKVVCSARNSTGYGIWGIPTYAVYTYSSTESQQGQYSFLQNGENAQFAVSHEDRYIKLSYIDQEISEAEKMNMQIFTYKNLQLGITRVCDVRTDTWTDDMGDSWEYPVYTCAPGAKIIVLNADMVDGAYCADGQSHGQWKIYQSASDYSWEERIEIVDNMKPFMITKNTKGIGAEDVYVLCLEMEKESMQ